VIAHCALGMCGWFALVRHRLAPLPTPLKFSKHPHSTKREAAIRNTRPDTPRAKASAMADSAETQVNAGQLPDGGVTVKSEPNGGDGKTESSGPRKRSRSHSKEADTAETKRQKGVAPIKAEYVKGPRPDSPQSTKPTQVPDTPVW
jgi:hypothetical protein